MPDDYHAFPKSPGEIVRRQRELAALSMRQFAATAGISNPYLSQIERAADQLRRRSSPSTVARGAVGHADRLANER